jgi:hypothetical protein
MMQPVGKDYSPLVEMDEDISVMLRLIKDMLVYGAPNIRRMSTNALRNSVREDANTIFIGGGFVDYAIYTNEPWKRGTNPNEGWVDRILMQGLQVIAPQLGYTIRRA